MRQTEHGNELTNMKEYLDDAPTRTRKKRERESRNGEMNSNNNKESYF